MQRTALRAAADAERWRSRVARGHATLAKAEPELDPSDWLTLPT
jgi:hypothetical protein